MQTYNRKLENIKNWNTTESNKKLVLSFLTKKEAEGLSLVQRLKYLISLKQFVSTTNKNFEDMTEKDMEKFLLSLNGYKPSTKHTRYYCVKKFLEFVGKKFELKVRFDTKNNKLPEELLTEEEVWKMVENCENPRDKAFISVLYESGCRIGELLPLKIRQVSFDQYGCVITVKGKTGQRRIRLIKSVPYLRNWLENHKLRNEPESYVWLKLHKEENQHMSYQYVRKLLKKLVEKTGIKKKVHPHLFRHSRLTELAKHLTEQELKVFSGWSMGSKMASVYVHLSGKDIENKLLEINGLKVEEKQETKLNKCFRCGYINTVNSKYCSNCGMVLDIKESLNLEEDFVKFLLEMYEKWKNRKF